MLTLFPLPKSKTTLLRLKSVLYISANNSAINLFLFDIFPRIKYTDNV